MSDYATLQDLKDRLGLVYAGLTDRSGARPAVADDVAGQELVTLAEGRINGKISGRYATPVDVSADVALATTMRDFALTIAAYLAYAKHPILQNQIPPAIQAEYTDAMKRLDEIAKGPGGLPGAAPIPSATSNGQSGTTWGHERILTEDAMEGLL